MTRFWLLDQNPVPIHLVLEAFGVHPEPGGRWWCELHDDRKPGGHPSATIPKRDPSMLWCWSCDGQMTAAQFIVSRTGCSFTDAIERANEIAGPGPFPPPQTQARPTLSPLDMEAVLRRDASRGETYEIDPVDAFVASRGWTPAFTDYARSQWQWRAGYLTGAVGRVLLPHRDALGLLTGTRWRCPPGRCWRCRKRHPNDPGWTKDARDGSRFGQLYGSWRLGDQDTIWIVEGEVDAALGGWLLEPWGIAVLGLPSANHPPKPEDLELLTGRRVVLAYDDDDPGRRARDRWGAALGSSVTATLVFDLETQRSRPLGGPSDACTAPSTGAP